MRPVVFLLVLAVSAGAQYIEGVIYLPDSLSGIENVNLIVHNPANNNVFVAERYESNVIVFDGVTNRRFARTRIRPVVAMCYNMTDNAVYCATECDTIFVLDGVSGRVLSVIPGTGLLTELCHNPIENKLYGVYSWEEDDDDSTVTVIDCDAGQVSGRIVVGRETEELCFNPDENRLYCTVSDSEGVAVIDCATDSITKYVYTGMGMYELLYNPLSRRLYVAEEDDDDLVILHTGPDTVVGWVVLGSGPGRMVLNTVRNEIYVLDYRDIDFICGHGDSLLGWIETDEWFLNAAFDSMGDAVFLAVDDTMLQVLDCAVDSITDTVWLSHRPSGFAFNPVQRHVYAGGEGVSVVDAESGQVEDFFRLWFGPGQVEYAASADRVYCASRDARELASIDAERNRLIGFVPIPGEPDRLAHADSVSRLYVSISYGSALAAVDCGSDSVVGEVALAGRPSQLLYSPGANKLYCAINSMDAVQVVACGPDTSLKLIEGLERAEEMILGPDGSRVFGLCRGSPFDTLFAIDCATDSVVALATTENYVRSPCYISRHREVAVAREYRPFVVAFHHAQTLELVGGAAVGFGPSFLVYSEASDRLYAMSQYESLVEVIDPVAREVVRRVDIGFRPTRLTRDTAADHIYVFGDDGVGVFDCGVDTIVTWLPVGFTNYAVSAPRHRRVYVSDWSDTRVWVIRDTTTVGIGGGVLQPPRAPVTQTVIRGVLNLAGSGTRSEFGTNSVMSLVDITGRKVMDLQPGENDVRHLSPGVYFVTPHPNPLPQGEREWRSRASGKRSAVRKVIVNP